MVDGIEDVPTRRLRFSFGAALFALIGTLALAGVARADNASLSVTTTDGQVDPAADVPRVFTVSGATSAPTQLYVKYRAAGGSPCAPTAYSDSGDWLDGFVEQDVNGAFKIQRAFTWPSPGTVMFCVWIASRSSTVTNPITQVIDFRKAGGTISATLNPVVPRPGSSFSVQVTGTSEAPKRVFATFEHAGTPCAPTYRSATGTGFIDSMDVNGAFSFAKMATAPSAGNHQLCLWLADSSDDLAPVAGPQSIQFSVVAPPRPCTVPSVARGAITLGTAKRRIAKRHCRVGTIRYVRSRVVRLSPRGPRTLAPGSAVGIVVSAGRRP
jgi:hypothetical protein